MTYMEALRSAMEDELEKISAVRSGRTPFTAATLAGAKKLIKKGTMTKLSGLEPAKKMALIVGGSALGGAVGYHKTRKAVEDYKNGRELRKATQAGM